MVSDSLKINKRVDVDNSKIVLLVFFGVLLVDRFTKYFVLKFYTDRILFNENGLFGILPWWLSLVAFLLIIYFILKEKYYSLILSAILGAGLSNLVDRIFYKGVIDFISIGKFPVFNIADSVISLGVVYLVYKELRGKKK